MSANQVLLQPIAFAQKRSKKKKRRSQKVQNNKSKNNSKNPWEKGVRSTDKTKALAIFQAANKAYGGFEFQRAVALYERALKIWQHPRIHGNMVSALIRLEKFEEALTHLEKALAYGDKPFEPEIYTALVNNQKLISNILTRITVSCRLEGAQITLDGEQLLNCPGKVSKVVRVGAHKLVAEKAGYLVTTKDVSPTSNEELQVLIDPRPIERSTVLERRWPRHVPWVVTGTGVVVATVGVPFLLRALDNRDEYEIAFARFCTGKGSGGCTEQEFRQSDDFDDYRGRVRAQRWQKVVATSAFAVGGAAIITGAIMVYLNQPRAIRLTPETVSITPWLSTQTPGVTATFRF